MDDPVRGPVTYDEVVQQMRAHELTLAKAIISRHRAVFPPTQDIRYVVTQRNGRVKVRFEPQEVPEPGYSD